MLSICFALLQNPEDKLRFEEFYNKFYNTVYFIAKEHLRTHEAAQDCAQEIKAPLKMLQRFRISLKGLLIFSMRKIFP